MRSWYGNKAKKSAMKTSQAWSIRLLTAIVVCMALAAGGAMYLTIRAAQALSSPDPHNDLWFVANLSGELDRIGSLARKSVSGESETENLRTRVDVLYSLLHPDVQAPRLSAPLLTELPESRTALQTLEQHVQIWGEALGSPEKAPRVAVDIAREIEITQPALRKAMAEVHLAATNQMDKDRITLHKVCALLSWILLALLIGAATLVWRLVDIAQCSNLLSRNLANTNKQLEIRVKERTRQLSESKSLLMFILDASPIDVTLLSAENARVLFMNKRLLRRLGRNFAPESMPLASLLTDSDCARRLGSELARVGFVDGLEGQISAPVPYWSSLSARLIQVDGEMVQLIWGFDISTHKAMETQLRALATTDPLSELDNRRAFFEKGERLVQYCRRYHRTCAALMIDIDHFKKVNDEYGHHVGDEAIRTVGRTLRGLMRDADIVGRIGGEEFSVLLPESNVQSALDVAERIRAKIEGLQIRIEGDKSLGITVSIGASTLQPSVDSLKQLVGQADEALYRAKKTGRNRIVLDEDIPAEPLRAISASSTAFAVV
jgi:diguanylate cyclase (GGDEF)-like protein